MKIYRRADYVVGFIFALASLWLMMLTLSTGCTPVPTSGEEVAEKRRLVEVYCSTPESTRLAIRRIVVSDAPCAIGMISAIPGVRPFFYMWCGVGSNGVMSLNSIAKLVVAMDICHVESQVGP